MDMLLVSICKADCHQPSNWGPRNESLWEAMQTHQRTIRVGAGKVLLELSSVVDCSSTFSQCPYLEAPQGFGFE